MAAYLSMFRPTIPTFCDRGSSFRSSPLVTRLLPARRLNPVLVIGDERFALQTHLLSAVPAAILVRPIDNLDRYYDEITDAIGLIFNGF